MVLLEVLDAAGRQLVLVPGLALTLALGVLRLGVLGTDQ